MASRYAGLEMGLPKLNLSSVVSPTGKLFLDIYEKGIEGMRVF